MTDRDSTPTTRLRARLEQEYGMDEAAILMDRPPEGWDSLVTHASLDDQLARFTAELRTELHVEIAGVRTEIAELRTEIAELRTEFRTEIAELRTELRTEIAGLRTESRTGIAELRTGIADGFRAQTWRLITALVATVAAFASVAGVAAAIA